MMPGIRERISKKRIGFLFGVLLFLCVLGILLYKDVVVEESKKPYNAIDLNVRSMELSTNNDSMIIKQSFQSSVDCIDGLIVGINPYGRENKNPLSIALYDGETGDKIQEWDVTDKVGAMDTEIAVKTATPLEHTRQKSYQIEIEESGIDSDNQIAFYASEANNLSTGVLVHDGEEQRGDLCFAVTSGNRDVLRKIYLFIFFIVFLIILVLLLATLFCKLQIHWLFLLYCILIGTIYLFVLSPYSTADERAHIMSAYAVSNQLMSQDKTDDQGMVLVREEDNQIYYEAQDFSADNYITVWNNLSASCGNERMISGSRGALTTPWYAYFIPAVGMTIARIFHFNNVWLLFCGRFMNLLVFALLTAFGIKCMPLKKELLFVVGMLPMTLAQGASYSYDALTNGLAFGFIGYVCYLAYKKEQIKKQDWFILISIMALIAPIKVVYVLLGILCFLIPNKKMKWKNRVGIGRGIPLLCGIIIVAVFRLSAVVGMLNTPSVTERIEGGQSYSISFIVHNMWHTLALFIRTITTESEGYYFTMLGQKLGYLNIEISYFIITGFGVLLVLAILMKSETVIQIELRDRGIMCISCLSVTFTILCALLFSYTYTNELTIAGVQGRYFLPILPLAMLALSSDKWMIKNDSGNRLYLGLIVLQMLTIQNIVESVIVR